MSNTNTIKPTVLDFQRIRKNRQICEYEKVYNKVIEGKFDKRTINEKSLDRILDYTEMKKDDLCEESRNNPLVAKLLAMLLAKQTSRQGIKDEESQISACSITGQAFGIKITNLSPTAFRATTTTYEIISNKEYKKRGFIKSECLKSFDGRISGQISGWIFAKIAYGTGGHQDSVFTEAHSMCNWIVEYQKQKAAKRHNQSNNQNDNKLITILPNDSKTNKTPDSKADENSTDELFVILIDTDLTRKLDALRRVYAKEKNIFIGGHADFQQYLINKYVDSA